eukprot:1190163-Prorocentrum_minimum.AAC.1
MERSVFSDRMVFCESLAESNWMNEMEMTVYDRCGGTFGEHAGNMRGTFGEQSGNIRGTCGEHSGNILETFKEVNIRGTFGEHSGNIRSNS